MSSFSMISSPRTSLPSDQLPSILPQVDDVDAKNGGTRKDSSRLSALSFAQFYSSSVKTDTDADIFLDLANGKRSNKIYSELPGGQRNKPALTKYCMTCPLWSIFLFQLVITIVIFSVIIIILSASDQKSKNEAMDNYITKVLNTISDNILLRMEGFINSGLTLRSNLNQRSELFRCQDDDTIERSSSLLIYFYNIVYTSELIKYIYIDQLSNITNPSTGKFYVTECGAGIGALWKTFKNKQNLSKYEPPLLPYNMYYEKKEYNLILKDFKIKDAPLENASWVLDAFNTDNINLYSILNKDLEGEWSLVVSIVFAITMNATFAAINKSSAAITFDVDTMSVSGLLLMFTPNTNGAHTTLYDHSNDPFRLLGATAIPAINLTIMPSGNTTANFWLAGQTSNNEVNDAYTQVISLCPKKCSSINKITEDRVISAKTISFQNFFTFFLVQSTPKSYYFGEMIASRNKTIILSIIGVVIIILICIFIWFAVRRPISYLRVNMDLAAIMQNDKVVPTPSYLSELQELSVSFNTMNAKLLIARAFMPEAYLAEGKEEDESECDDLDNIEAATSNVKIGREKSAVSLTSEGACSSGKYESEVKNQESSRSINQKIIANSVKSQEKAVLHRMTLGTKRVAVLALNIRGFHKMSSNNVINVMQNTELFLTTVQNSSVMNNGVVDSYHGDHIVITFNATRIVGSSGSRAVICALNIREKLENTDISKLSMGAAVGTTLVGSMGNDKMRRFSVVGHSYSNAIKLEQASNRLERREGDSYGPFGCLINAAIASEIESTMDCQLVGQIFQFDEDHVLAYAINKLPAEQEDDEWMYQLENAKNQFFRYNNAFMSLLKGDMEACKREIEQNSISNVSNPGYLVENEKRDSIDANDKPAVVSSSWERLFSIYNSISLTLNNNNGSEKTLPMALNSTGVSCWL